LIIDERRIARSLSSGARSRDPLAHPPYALHSAAVTVLDGTFAPAP
jgi:hypothetical protein